MKCESKRIFLHSIKCIWKCRQNGGRFLLQTILWNIFLEWKSLYFDSNLSPKVSLTTSQHWFSWWLRAEHATSHDTQRAHDVIITPLFRQNDVATSFWRYDDVIITSYVCWVWTNATIVYGRIYASLMLDELSEENLGTWKVNCNAYIEFIAWGQWRPHRTLYTYKVIVVADGSELRANAAPEETADGGIMGVIRVRALVWLAVKHTHVQPVCRDTEPHGQFQPSHHAPTTRYCA